MLKRYNISVPKTYQKDGQDKTAWSNVGTLVKFEATQDKPESYILELNMFPSTKFGVFEQTPREPQQPKVDTSMNTSAGFDGETINPEDIPF